jgi:hypothetical protein
MSANNQERHMKILTVAAGIALALGSVASSMPAFAQNNDGMHDRGDRGGYNNHGDGRDGRHDRRWNNHRRCWMEHHHHRNVRVCR